MTFDKWWMDYKANQRPAPMLTNVGAQYTYLDIRDAAKEAYHARNKPDTTALKDEIKAILHSRGRRIITWEQQLASINNAIDDWAGEKSDPMACRFIKCPNADKCTALCSWGAEINNDSLDD